MPGTQHPPILIPSLGAHEAASLRKNYCVRNVFQSNLEAADDIRNNRTFFQFWQLQLTRRVLK